ISRLPGGISTSLDAIRGALDSVGGLMKRIESFADWSRAWAGAAATATKPIMAAKANAGRKWCVVIVSHSWRRVVVGPKHGKHANMEKIPGSTGRACERGEAHCMHPPSRGCHGGG